MKRSTVIDLIAFLYMVLFLYTGLSKLAEYRLFSEQIAESPILAPIAPALAVGLPIVEIVLVVLLFIPKYRSLSLFSCLVLMILFSLYITGIMLFFDQLPCSCGGVLAELSWPQHLIFNGVFILLASLGVALQKHRRNDQKIVILDTNARQILS